MKKRLLTLIALGFWATWSQAQALNVWSAGAVQSAMEELVPQYERTSGVKLQVQYAPVGVWMRRLAAGEQADVLILTTDVVKEVESKAWVVPDSAKPLGSVGVGVAVKQGTVLPDVSTPQALRETLLRAQSLTYMDPQKGTSGKHFASVLEQLGIADQVKAKTKLGDIGYVLEPVARGEIEIGIQQITEILPVQGAVLVGPLPPSLQKTTTYVVLQATQAKDKATAVEFMRYLQTPASASVFERKGFSKPR